MQCAPIMIDWLNANAGAVSTVATVTIALSAAITVWLTRNLAKENRLLRKAGTEPSVVAYLKLHPISANVVNFVLANVGHGPARNVGFTFRADEDDFERHDVRIRNSSDRTLTTMLPQGDRIEVFFGIGSSLMKDPKLRSFTVCVRFQDLNGKDHSAEYALDVAQFTGFGSLGSPPEHEIAKTLNKIERGIAQLAKAIQRKPA